MNYTQLKTLRQVNVERMHRYPSCSGWNLLEWAGALCGEAGELANFCKKHLLVNGPTSLSSPEGAERERLRQEIGKEIADVLIYADLLAYEAGFDLWPLIVAKFNEVSERRGYPERLSL